MVLSFTLQLLLILLVVQAEVAAEDENVVVLPPLILLALLLVQDLHDLVHHLIHHGLARHNLVQDLLQSPNQKNQSQSPCPNHDQNRIHLLLLVLVLIHIPVLVLCQTLHQELHRGQDQGRSQDQGQNLGQFQNQNQVQPQDQNLQRDMHNSKETTEEEYDKILKRLFSKRGVSFIHRIKELQQLEMVKKSKNMKPKTKAIEYIKNRLNVTPTQATYYLYCVEVFEILEKFYIKPFNFEICILLHKFTSTPDQMRLLWEK